MPRTDRDERFLPPDLERRHAVGGELPEAFLKPLRTSQVIYAAVSAGVLVFSIVVLAIRLGDGGGAAGWVNLGELAWLLPLLLLAAGVPIAAVIRRRAMAQARLRPDGREAKFLAAMIASGAVLESSGLLAAVMALLSSDLRPLLVAAGCVAVLLLHFPSRASARRFLAE
jgi:hypothetical protein